MAKGPQFERDTARMLSLWFSERVADDWLWRSDGSGGRATNRSKRGKDTFGQYGDIRASHPDAHDLLKVLTIELKRGYSKHTLHDMLDHYESAALQQYEEWIAKARKDARRSGSFSWLLITRRDRRESLVAMPDKLWRQLVKSLSSPERLRGLSVHTLRGLVIRPKKTPMTLHVMLLGEFLELVEPATIRGIARRMK